MVKQLQLDQKWFGPFIDLLNAAPTFGPLMVNSGLLQSGRLETWVPAEVDALPSQDLGSDFFYGQPFDPWNNLCECFNRHLAKGPNQLIIADTRSRAMPLNMGPNLSSFTCQSPHNYREHQVCLYLTSRTSSGAAFDDLTAFAGWYPRMFTLTSVPAHDDLSLNESVTLDSPSLADLVLRAEQVLAGVFDERSYILWTR